MKEPRCLATWLAESTAADVVELYSRRFTIEEAFRDTEDIDFGMGLSATHIRDERRRDRLLLLVAVAQSLLTLEVSEKQWRDWGHDSASFVEPDGAKRLRGAFGRLSTP